MNENESEQINNEEDDIENNEYDPNKTSKRLNITTRWRASARGISCAGRLMSAIIGYNV
jgi:hypothetical protein